MENNSVDRNRDFSNANKCCESDALEDRGIQRDDLISEVNCVELNNGSSVLKDVGIHNNVDVVYEIENEIREKGVDEEDSGVTCEMDAGDGVNSSLDRSDLSERLRTFACTLSVLNDREKQDFSNLLIEHKELFTDKLGCAEGYEHRIRLVKDKVSIKRTYPVPIALRAAVEQEIQQMLKAGVIERSVTPYCSPLRIVRKANGKIRVCLDARYINECIEDDHESPPLIKELLQRFYGARWFSKMDLTHGYWQIPLHPDSRKYTGFLFDSKMYCFRRVPFGLKTAGSGFIRALSHAIGDELRDNLAMYIDDLLLGTNSIADHLRLLRVLFDKLKKRRFTLKFDKCQFFQENVPFLGFVLSSSGISPDPQKLDVIQKFEEPRNVKQLQRFLGICNYYREFSIRHSEFVDPLRELLKGNSNWQWTDKHSVAFGKLKMNFLQEVTLKHVIPNSTFFVQTDGSNCGVSGILFQIDPKGNICLIAVASRCLSESEKHYTTTEKELLAIVYSVSKFRVYLIGVHFEIVTDHKALTFLGSTQYHSGRLIRWSLLMQQYSYSVRYCKGSDNVVADFFSRNPEGKFMEQETDTYVIAALHQCTSFDYFSEKESTVVLATLASMNDALKRDLCKLKELQAQDDTIRTKRDEFINSEGSDLYKVYNGVLFHRNHCSETWQIIIPTRIKLKLIEDVHSRLGHPGVYKTVAYLKQFYYWRGMQRQVKKYVLTCDLCQRVKYATQSMEGEYQFIDAKCPGDLVSVDFYGPLPRGRGGMQYIFVLLDVFSKYVCLYPMKRATTAIVLKRIFDDYIDKCGKPKRILSDHGTQFTSLSWKTRLESAGIKVLYSSIRHPQSNPTERVMRELGRLFRTLCASKHTKWVNFLQHIESILNVTTHHSTGYTPQELHFGTPVQDDIQKIINFPTSKYPKREYQITLARDRLKNKFENRKKQQSTISKIKLKINDLVMLRVPHLSSALEKVTKKFFHLYEGPYRIFRVVGNNAFTLVDRDDEMKQIGTYNRASLKPYHEAV